MDYIQEKFCGHIKYHLKDEMTKPDKTLKPWFLVSNNTHEQNPSMWSKKHC